MLADNREKFKKIENTIGKIFSKVGLTPNQFTLLSLFSVALSFYFLVKVDLFLAFIFFLCASLLDLVDGNVAKVTGKKTKKGAYLDTICDRYVEGIILLGFLFLPLPPFFLPAKVWISLALFGSLMTTYSKSAAKEKELITKELKKGLFGRPERIILIFIAMIFGIFNLSLVIYPIIILAIFSNLTALQRIYFSLRTSN